MYCLRRLDLGLTLWDSTKNPGLFLLFCLNIYNELINAKWLEREIEKITSDYL